MNAHRLVIAGTHSGSGKTTMTLALLASLHDRGRSVQAFKIGPDFIDPGHHAVITGRPSRNLDGWMLGPGGCRKIFTLGSSEADISIIEGMMGVFDGSSPTQETGSTAEVAKWLRAPVVLVIDGSAMARSAAAIALGFARFDPNLQVVGVVFNRVHGPSHYKLLKEAVEHETSLASLGYLPPSDELVLGDRHLGLVTALEQGTHEVYAKLGRAAAETIDLDRIEALASSAVPLDDTGQQALDTDSEAALTFPGNFPTAKLGTERIRIGLAWDPAFCFYYPENLELLEAEGAELVRFSPVADPRLPPDLDMLYLGGGYPELHGKALAANEAMREAIRQWAEHGGGIYAECGGLMYLAEAIRDFNGQRHPMVGLFPIEAVMERSTLTLGYRTLIIEHLCLLGKAGVRVKGHEFHYSRLEPRVNQDPLPFACSIEDASGRERRPDGLVTFNCLALYTHLHFGSCPSVARNLLAQARHETAT